MRNVKRRTQDDSKAILVVLGFLLRPAKHAGTVIQRIRSCIENGIVGAIENGAVGLIDIESAHSSAEGEHPRTSSESSTAWTSTWSATLQDDRPSPAAKAPFSLHAIANFLNPILKLIGIHAEVLSLSHRACNRNRFGWRIRARAIQR